MFKSIFKVTGSLIDVANQEFFTPFVNCYYLHSVIVSFNGVSYEEDNDFYFIGHKTKWTGAFVLVDTDVLIFDLNYFYIKPDNLNVLSFIVDATYADPNKSNEIISKHYIEGQFSLDNSLYKNAVLNFGTTLEGILNKPLANQDLNDLIDNYPGTADKAKMHSLRQLRNKVHPNRISTTQDVTRKEAIEARQNLELIIRHI
jgi:hypothetical protein